MSNANFKFNNNQSAEKQIELLQSIQSTQNSILDKISSLDNRISKIEQTPKTTSFHCEASNLQKVLEEKASDISKAISNISTDLKNNSTPDDDYFKQLKEKISDVSVDLKAHIITLVLGATLFISCWLAAFAWWFWDVPAQTQAVNNFAYQQTHQGENVQHSQ